MWTVLSQTRVLEYLHLSKMSLENNATGLKTHSVQEFDEIHFETDICISFGIDGGLFDFPLNNGGILFGLYV